MVLRLIVAALVLCGLTLLGLAAYSYFAPLRGPALAVGESDLDLGECTAGKETDVVFRLQNNSGHAVRVLGLVLC
jgi:hypothetical protein